MLKKVSEEALRQASKIEVEKKKTIIEAVGGAVLDTTEGI